MARIRSTHPDQWNDDDFVELSPLARQLSLGIRNFADDNGILPVKLKRWKMQVLPADNCDMEKLGKELIEHRQIHVYEVDGVQYAAIRNFTKYQRPKSPSFIYPLPNSSEMPAGNGYEFQKSDDVSGPSSGNRRAGEGRGEKGRGEERRSSARARARPSTALAKMKAALDSAGGRGDE